MTTEIVNPKEINEYIRNLELVEIERFKARLKKIDDLFYRLKKGEASKEELHAFMDWRKNE